MENMFARKAQTLTEFALIIGVAGLVFIGMQIYAKRGLQGKVKDLTDGFMGATQAAYQQDMSGFTVNNSISSTNSASRINATEERGGGRAVIGYENTSSSYSYESQQ